jgi:hypothetical protein
MESYCELPIGIAHHFLSHRKHNRIGCSMVSGFPLSAVDRGFEPRSYQTKDYKIGICCFSAKHAALRKKSKDWLDRNQDHVSQWGYLSYQRTVVSVCWSSTKRTSSSFPWKLTCSSHDIADKLLRWHSTTITHSLIQDEMLCLK